MPKKPSTPSPVIGDKVKLKGRPNTGVLTQISVYDWAVVKWDNEGPIFCSLHELEAISQVPK
jgi:hypothetical protein